MSLLDRFKHLFSRPTSTTEPEQEMPRAVEPQVPANPASEPRPSREATATQQAPIKNWPAEVRESNASGGPEEDHPETGSLDTATQNNYHENPIITRVRFFPILSFDTPASAISRFGEVAQAGQEPDIGSGSWRPLVSETDEPLKMATPLGPLGNAIHDYARFLTKVRVIYEERTAVSVKEALFRRLPSIIGEDGYGFGLFIERHKGIDWIVDRFLPRTIDLMPVSRSVKTALLNAGYDTLLKITEASDTDLFALKGVGPKSVAAMRQFIAETDLNLVATRVEKDPEYRVPH